MHTKSITDIKSIFENSRLEDIPEIIREYNTDERMGVQKLIKQYDKKITDYQKELERLDNMKEYERKYNTYDYICGIDEAGRGPLAGPVVSAAVILPKNINILYLNDSKKLSEKKREQLYTEIKEKALAYSVGIETVEKIEEINILKATLLSMTEAVNKLKIMPQILLIDAVTLNRIPIRQESIIEGDAKSISIAAASVIAKVTRDRIMYEYDKIYPEYGFAKHKGYGTKEHIEAIKTYGTCPIHRSSFLKNIYV